MDAVASLYGRNSLLDIVQKTAQEIFIPLTVGGGLRTVDDIRTVLRAGADKVSINTAAIQRPELIREASRAFGSSTIVVAIEAIQKPDGSYEAYTDYGRQKTGVEVLSWAQRATELGAGELLVTSIDREGTGQGFDLALTRRIAEAVPIPVIAHGGAGKATDVHDVIVEGKADAVSMASMLHYHGLQQLKSHTKNCFDEGNTEFLRRGTSFSKIQPMAVTALKLFLAQHGIECRCQAVG